MVHEYSKIVFTEGSLLFVFYLIYLNHNITKKLYPMT